MQSLIMTNLFECCCKSKVIIYRCLIIVILNITFSHNTLGEKMPSLTTNDQNEKGYQIQFQPVVSLAFKAFPYKLSNLNVKTYITTPFYVGINFRMMMSERKWLNVGLNYNPYYFKLKSWEPIRDLEDRLELDILEFPVYISLLSRSSGYNFIVGFTTSLNLSTKYYSITGHKSNGEALIDLPYNTNIDMAINKVVFGLLIGVTKSFAIRDTIFPFSVYMRHDLTNNFNREFRMYIDGEPVQPLSEITTRFFSIGIEIGIVLD